MNAALFISCMIIATVSVSNGLEAQRMGRLLPTAAWALVWVLACLGAGFAAVVGS